MALVGVARALEEAGIEPAEIVGCSGGAIWGSMWAGGLSAQEMAEFSLSLEARGLPRHPVAEDPRFALSALRGFTGLAKGEAIERLFDERLAGCAAARPRSRSRRSSTTWTSGRVEYFGSDETPDVTVGHLVRVAIALPLFIESVPVRGHLYVDGGIIEVWPIQPILDDGPSTT